VLDLFTLSISELEKILSNIDSTDLVDYLINLDTERKKIILDRIKTVLGNDYVYFLNSAINYKVRSTRRRYTGKETWTATPSEWYGPEK
jgi:hypothetical protein